MDTNIKSLTNEYFNNAFLWWSAFIIAVHMLSVSEINEGILKFVISSLALFGGIKFLFSFFTFLNFIEKNKKTMINEEILNDIIPIDELKQRSIFNYIKKFPAEHPFILLSIIGLIFTEQYTDFSKNFYQVFENIPILNSILPPLLLVILLMMFSDYTYYINVKFIRRAIKIIILVYSPFIIGFFFSGLLSPLFLIIKEIFNIDSIENVRLFFSSNENLFWLIAYPWTALYLLKCNFINNQQIIEVK